MAVSTTQTLDPADETTLAPLPTQDPCCQSPRRSGMADRAELLHLRRDQDGDRRPHGRTGHRRFWPGLRDCQGNICPHALPHRQAARRAGLHSDAAAWRENDPLPERSVSPHNVRNRAVLGANDFRPVCIGSVPTAEFQRFQFAGASAEQPSPEQRLGGRRLQPVYPQHRGRQQQFFEFQQRG
jgi:hypothetical protein